MILKTTDPHLAGILGRIMAERNVDFSQYREGILERRIMARVRIAKRENFEQYLAYLKFHPEEMDYLMEAMTINVTEFFRDANVFEAIEAKIIPELFKKKREAGSRIARVWSAACSSGEEAYSVLMLVAEHLGTELTRHKVSIYGTDIDAQALAAANEGVYEASKIRRLPAGRKELLEKYFYKMGNNRYWIREEWPAYTHFFYHDLIADIPLNRMDMILCRNVFIYFNRELQKQIVKRLWGSLNKGGFLILGNVESMDSGEKDRFAEYDRRARVYVKK